MQAKWHILQTGKRAADAGREKTARSPDFCKDKVAAVPYAVIDRYVPRPQTLDSHEGLTRQFRIGKTRAI